MNPPKETYMYYSPNHTANIVLTKEPYESLKQSHMNIEKEPYTYHTYAGNHI